MRLPQFLLDSPFFQFSTLAELEKALADSVSDAEITEIRRLVALGIPPVASRLTLATILGISPGLVWSFQSRPQRYYRTFYLPKGNSQRKIDAPKVGLKIIQKWLAVQLQRYYCPPKHVFGFVANRSHIQAAAQHCDAKWIFSVDIENFFQSTLQTVVSNSLEAVGYSRASANLLSSLCCLRGALAQGAPSSPVLSNICFQALDEQLARLADKHEVRLTRYADDIVFSGCNDFPQELRKEVIGLFDGRPWQLAEQKTHFSMLPKRLKVHGLLVHGQHVRLTKGYRNRLRAFKHLLAKGGIGENELAIMQGHLHYADLVERVALENIES